MKTKVFTVAIATTLLLSACNEEAAYTLYRDSPLETNGRIHVATFDANEREEYNSSNCKIAADLFQSQEGVVTTFWCEKGRYKK